MKKVGRRDMENGTSEQPASDLRVLIVSLRSSIIGHCDRSRSRFANIWGILGDRILKGNVWYSRWFGDASCNNQKKQLVLLPTNLKKIYFILRKWLSQTANLSYFLRNPTTKLKKNRLIYPQLIGNWVTNGQMQFNSGQLSTEAQLQLYCLCKRLSLVFV